MVFGDELASELLGPLAGGAQDEGGYGVEFVGDGAEAEAAGFEGDAAAAGGDVQHYRVGDGQVVAEPLALGVGEVVGEGAGH